MRINDIEPVFVEQIPRKIEEGKIYISNENNIAIHLCCCGCNGKTVTPLGPRGWNLIESKYMDGTVQKINISLSPSIGNWSWEKPSYHAHYFITNNKVIWC